MKSFEKILVSASERWVNEGVITAAQRAAILSRHPVAEGGGHMRFVGIMATVGGLLFAVGISLIIKANWQSLGDWTKIGGLVALLIAAYGAGWKLKIVDRHFTKTGDAALMIGQIFFLCGIVLVSQIFHLNSRPATGVLIWWLGIAAIPWLTRAKGAQFVSIVAGLVWLGMEMATKGSWIWLGDSAAGFGRNVVTEEAVFVLLGLALWMAGIGLRGTRWRDFAAMHELWGLVVTGGALYALGFLRHVWEWRHRTGGQLVVGNWLPFGLGLALVAVAGVTAWRARRDEVKALLPWIALGLLPVAAVVFVGPLGEEGWLWSAVAWLVLFAWSVAVVRVGIESGREGWVNLGILFIATNIITRYFDLFGTMLDGGVFFVVTGLIVTGLGIYLERKRRSLLARVRAEVRP